MVIGANAALLFRYYFVAQVIAAKTNTATLSLPAIVGLLFVLARCKLYDYETSCWRDFKGSASGPVVALGWQRKASSRNRR